AITSVQSQTYPKLEVVVINDCSTDETFNYLESLKFTKGDLKIIIIQENYILAGTILIPDLPILTSI
ncbi:MAG: glycosyltransferase family 2 protein, partial [Erysipelothrix sp.]|nr:glycosyltransferase family 2 protein [Erysipelothrix sp.]